MAALPAIVSTRVWPAGLTPTSSTPARRRPQRSRTSLRARLATLPPQLTAPTDRRVLSAPKSAILARTGQLPRLRRRPRPMAPVTRPRQPSTWRPLLSTPARSRNLLPSRSSNAGHKHPPKLPHPGSPSSPTPPRGLTRCKIWSRCGRFGTAGAFATGCRAFRQALRVIAQWLACRLDRPEVSAAGRPLCGVRQRNCSGQIQTRPALARPDWLWTNTGRMA
jgi:hypothetical protein